MTTQDALSGKVLEIINQVQSVVTDHSKYAMDMALNCTFIDGVWGFIIGAFCIAFLFFSYKWIIKLNRISNIRKYEDYQDGCIFGMIILAIFSVFSLWIVLCQFLDIWNYIQVFNPKFYLAHEVINGVVNK